MEWAMIMVTQMEREQQIARSEECWRYGSLVKEAAAAAGARRVALRQRVARVLVLLAGHLTSSPASPDALATPCRLQ